MGKINKTVDVCDFCGVEDAEDVELICNDSGDVCICEKCVDLAKEKFKKNASHRVAVSKINYDATACTGRIKVSLDVDIIAHPTFENMKLVEKLGTKINDIKL